jgi:hypothetical protein
VNRKVKIAQDSLPCRLPAMGFATLLTGRVAVSPPRGLDPAGVPPQVGLSVVPHMVFTLSIEGSGD